MFSLNEGHAAVVWIISATPSGIVHSHAKGVHVLISVDESLVDFLQLSGKSGR